MYVLGLDTSTDHAICLVSDEFGQVYHSAVERHDRDLSARLYPLFDRVLSGAHVGLGQIDVLAAGLGPGSFTGVRIAVTTLRTLAQVTGKRLIGVSTLAILASSARAIADINGQEICAVLPSRRNEVYAARFMDGVVTAPAVTATYPQALQLCKHSVLAGPTLLLDSILAQDEADFAWRRVDVDAPSPESFAKLAADQIASGQFADPLSLDPMYIAAPAVSQHKSISSGL